MKQNLFLAPVARLKYFCLLAVLSAACPALGDERPEPGVVSGIVVQSDDGAPVAGAKVFLQDRKRYQVESDAEGHFRREKIPAGDYRIWAYHGKLTSQKQTIRPVASEAGKEPIFAPLRLEMAVGK